MAAILALASAATFGIADFLGGLSSRKASAVAVAFLTNLSGAVLALVVLALVGGEWSASAILWGMAGGVCGLVGLILLYSGLAIGPNKLVSPVSAIVAALVPVSVGISLGDRPDRLAILGLGLAAPAIWLLAGGGLSAGSPDRRPLLLAVGAGIGFGTFFTFIAQVPDGSGAVPLLTARIASVVILAVVVARARPSFPQRPWLAVSALAGTLDMTANGLFLWSTRDGDLAIVGALVSLFPATTVLLAVVVLHERLSRSQMGGLVLAVGAAALLA